jgi:uncharacterized peroxidase-related enzyme
MKFLNTLTKDQAPQEAQPIFDALIQKIGKVPNLYAATAHSPATLKGILDLTETLGGAELSAKEVEAVALAVGQENDCGYCLSAHSAIGKMQGFSEADTIALRSGTIEDTKLNALTALARDIVVTRGRPNDASVHNFFDAGYSEGALVNVIGLVALNTFTNYLNRTVETTIDFPIAPELETVAS